MLYNSIAKCRDYFNRLQTEENWFRFGKTFKTRNKYYYFDTGTGKIFEVNYNVYRVLDCILKTNDFKNLSAIGLDSDEIESALYEIEETVKQEKILSATKMKSMTGAHVHQLQENLDSKLNQITLELTERCNLRCKYCLYAEKRSEYRNFGNIDMTYDIAIRAVDFLFKHSKDSPIIYVGFYGGEPLLRFDLVKDVTDYTINKAENEGRRVIFSITTNLTLLTKEMAEYFANIEDFTVMISLDGPKEIHDEHRVFSDGTGSFDSVMKGIEYLNDAYKATKKQNMVVVSLVISHPYTSEKFDEIDIFFKSLRDTVISPAIQASYVSYDPEKESYIEINDRIENKLDYEPTIRDDPLELWGIGDYDFNHDNRFAHNYIERPLLFIHNRQILNRPTENYFFMGCCIPGARKAYITTTGNILPCERIGTLAAIGNVFDGYDVAKIKKIYVDDYMTESLIYCSECWAATLCTNCYDYCFNLEGEIDFSYRHRKCRNTRKQLETDLIYYHELLEHAPRHINKLNDMVFV